MTDGVAVEQVEVVHGTAALRFMSLRGSPCSPRRRVRVPSWSMPSRCASSKYGTIAPEVVRDDLEVRPAVRSIPRTPCRAMHALVSYGQPKSHQISNFDFFSESVVGQSRAARRVQPDRQVVLLRHALEDRRELGLVERAAVHVGEDLDSARAQSRSIARSISSSAARTLFIGSDATNAGKSLRVLRARSRPCRRWRGAPAPATSRRGASASSVGRESVRICR